MTKRFLCDLPWNHISVHPHSTTSICCAAKHSNGASNAKSENGDIISVNDGIEQVMNSHSYKEIRKTMLKGRVPEACEGCWKVEQVGGTSKRLKDSRFNLDFDNLTSPDGSIEINLTNVELRLGNFCNLKCRSCNAESSTSWITDYYKLKDEVPLPSSYDTLKKSTHTDYTWVENEKFYDDLISNAPNINIIHISGGEPFLVPKHFYLLEKLIELGKTDVRISYITNANWDYEKVKVALELLNNFRYVNISFSLDDVGDRNTYIRSQSDWNLTIDNIKKLIFNYPKFYYTITQTINAYNFLYVEELSQFLVNEGIYSHDKRNYIKDIQLNHVHSPEYQNANVLPIDVRKKKIDSISGLISNSNWQELYGRYYNGEENGQMELFKKVTNAVDLVRNESLYNVFPKLDDVINKKQNKLI
jgi:organic radical activating enzyme